MGRIKAFLSGLFVGRGEKEKGKTYTLTLSRRNKIKCTRLVERGGFASLMDMLNSALTILEWVIKKREQGYSIVAIKDDAIEDDERELNMDFLEKIKKRNSPQEPD